MSATDRKIGFELARALFVVAAFVVVVAGIRTAAVIMVPFLLALFIAVVTTPLYIGLQRRGLPSAVALLVIIIGLAGLGVGGVALVGTPMKSFTADLPTYQTQLQEQTHRLLAWLDAHGIDTPEQVVYEFLNPQAAMRLAGGMVNAMSGLISKTFIILLIAIFMLLEAAILPGKVEKITGLSAAASDRLRQIVEDVRQYMAMKTLMSLLTGVLVSIWLVVMGVKYPILLGLLAFLLNYVPTIGSFIAAVPAILLAVIVFGPGQAVIVAAGYVVINVGVSNVLEPRFMGRGLGLSPLIILVSMIFWGWVLGPVGMLLSVPLTMAVKIAMEHSDDSRWVALLMGSGRERTIPLAKRTD